MYEERLDLMHKAESIIVEASKQEGYQLPELLSDALVAAIKLHGLTQAGAFRLVEALANAERQAGRLPPKPDKPLSFDD